MHHQIAKVLNGKLTKLQRIHRSSCSDIFPSSETIIVRHKNIVPESNLKEESKVDENMKNLEYRVNDVNIQMISKNIYEQLFRGTTKNVVDPTVIKSCQEHLNHHGIDYGVNDVLPDVKLQLPKLEGKDVVEHFYNVGEQQAAPYRELLQKLARCKLPPVPKQWSDQAGWSRYSCDGTWQTVPYPPDDALILDVEVLMSAGKRPTLACAVSADAWYGWVSERVTNKESHTYFDSVEYDSLIPLETDGGGAAGGAAGDAAGGTAGDAAGGAARPRLVVGHNVSYDRSKLKEQYWLERTGLRFMDTMSMHTCVSGVTSYQRAVLKTREKNPETADEDWMDISSLNSLSEVHKLYCGSAIDKRTRDVFVEGTMSDVIEQFQSLMTYCASDVIATCAVLRELLPLFLQRFPHPATLAGMLELGSAYLPVNSNWLQYIESAETVFEDLKLETRQLLSLKADQACRLMIDQAYRRDIWMWDQDWSTQRLKLKKQKPAKSKKKSETEEKPSKKQPQIKHTRETKKTESDFQYLNEEYIKFITPSTEPRISDERMEDVSKKFEYLYDLGQLLPAKRPYLAGYPEWYRKLCTKPGKDPDWIPGANNITTSMRITPKLLRLSWEGYPLHHIASEGWGFLVPFARSRPVSYEPEDEPQVPLSQLLEACPMVEGKPGGDNSDRTMEKLAQKVEEDMGRRTYYARKKVEQQAAQHQYHGLGVWSGVQLQGCCHFLRLPHKDGPKHKVGNPLAKDFLDMFSQNVLSAQGNEAEKVLKFGRMMSYWRNNRERIMGQQVVWLPRAALPPELREGSDPAAGRRYGAILPQVVVCGTLTRRAMEPTWMTASNAHPERVGSELRAMVQSPPGYKFVGADVDSQELWIASLLGDSTVGVCGGTALGWAVLAGSRAAGTDLHSLTARAAQVSRDHAKVINYARIYGAGQNFAERLLKQFNPTMTSAEAKSKAAQMFSSTKGRRVYRLKQQYMEGLMDEDLDGQAVEMSSYQAARLARLSGRRVEDMFERPRWRGGSESHMFNKLEDIADSQSPATAFLSGRMSRALEAAGGRWAGTRHNWAVQSAAADFLHLMLVSMRHLAPTARFCLSFHDEVRYLVCDARRYEAALALQLTNLLTRAFCSQRVGLADLPLSVAFFSSVEVDGALRKEPALACATPSNPHGLRAGYGVPEGEALDVHAAVRRAAPEQAADGATTTLLNESPSCVLLQ